MKSIHTFNDKLINLIFRFLKYQSQSYSDTRDSIIKLQPRACGPTMAESGSACSSFPPVKEVRSAETSYN